MGLFARKLGLDIGTVNVLICDSGQIVLQEPSLVALTAEDERIVEIGQPAREMLGKTDDEDIQVVRPLRDGVIADYEVTEAMLRHFFSKVGGRVRLFRPTVMVAAPWGVTSVEKRAVHEATLAAGAREAWLINEPLAAAIGAGAAGRHARRGYGRQYRRWHHRGRCHQPEQNCAGGEWAPGWAASR